MSYFFIKAILYYFFAKCTRIAERLFFVLKYTKIVYLAFFLFPINLGYGQAEIAIKPYSFLYEIKDSIPKIIMPEINLPYLKLQDSLDNIHQLAPRFGYSFSVDINAYNSGFWMKNDKGNFWMLRVKCKGALSINLMLEQLYLPEGSVFFISNQNKTQFDDYYPTEQAKVSTRLYYGEEITLEYYAPLNVEERPIIKISKVVHGYRYIRMPQEINASEPSGSGNCQVNINCEEGVKWQDQKKGVALILVNGNRWCTGTLLNNTSEDSTPYLLTANHCLDGLDAAHHPDASHWSFLWNYESPACENRQALKPVLTLGAEVVANNPDSDFALLRLHENPRDFLPVFFNGWSRSSEVLLWGVCIHHPSGDIKKIASFFNYPTRVSIDAFPYKLENFWQIKWSATRHGYSVTEGGSSGSALFNHKGLVVGQLYGGSAVNCSDPANDPGIFGKLKASWNGPDPKRRLKDWLDPLNTKAMELKGF